MIGLYRTSITTVLIGHGTGGLRRVEDGPHPLPVRAALQGTPDR